MDVIEKGKIVNGRSSLPKTGIRIIETGEIFASQIECADLIGGNQGSISHCLSGRRQTHKGFHFEYVN